MDLILLAQGELKKQLLSFNAVFLGQTNTSFEFDLMLDKKDEKFDAETFQRCLLFLIWDLGSENEKQRHVAVRAIRLLCVFDDLKTWHISEEQAQLLTTPGPVLGNKNQVCFCDITL